MFANVTAGQVYRNTNPPNSDCVRYNCLGPHSLIVETMSSGCKRAKQAMVLLVACGPSSDGEYSCLAPPVGGPEVTPISAASTNLIASAFLISSVAS